MQRTYHSSENQIIAAIAAGSPLLADRNRTGKPKLASLLLAAATLLLAVPESYHGVALAQGNERPSQKYHVGAWFFDLWNSAAHGFQIQNGEKIYGRTDPWAGVRDFAQGLGAFAVGESPAEKNPDYSGREPQLGFYDLNSDETVAAEIAEGKAAGLEFFAFYWYIDPATGQELNTSPTVGKLANYRPVETKFLLAPISGDAPADVLSKHVWRDVIVPKIISYMASPAYMTLEGRPVLMDFKTRFATAEEGRSEVDFFRAEVERRLRKNPLIVSVLGGKAHVGDAMYRRKTLGVDGFACFQFPVGYRAEPYSQFVQNWQQQMMQQITPEYGSQPLALPYLPCGSIGIDARPWFGIGWGNAKTPGGAADRPYVVGTSPDLFRAHLLELKHFIDSRQVNTLNTVLLYAWNEWGEASESIEPSKKLGDGYAAAIREVFGAPEPPHDQARQNQP
jgi:Glycosyltransferase WbsX